MHDSLDACAAALQRGTAGQTTDLVAVHLNQQRAPRLCAAAVTQAGCETQPCPGHAGWFEDVILVFILVYLWTNSSLKREFVINSGLISVQQPTATARAVVPCHSFFTDAQFR